MTANMTHFTLGKIRAFLFVLVFYVSLQSEIWPNFHIWSVSTSFLTTSGWYLRSGKTATWLVRFVTSKTLSQGLGSSSKQKPIFSKKRVPVPQVGAARWRHRPSWSPSGVHVIGESLAALGHSVRVLFAFFDIAKWPKDGKRKTGPRRPYSPNRKWNSATDRPIWLNAPRFLFDFLFIIGPISYRLGCTLQ